MKTRLLDMVSPEPPAWRDAVEDGKASLKDAARAARNCRACRLWEGATQTVFGKSESRRKPQLLLVGEQPGDREDITGAPFVGPAGKILDEAIEDAGIDRRTTYLTNVVKHFSFELRGKRRVHKRPKANEIRACRPWLEAEISALKPNLVVCLGATAAQAVIGVSFRVTKSRGTLVSSSIAPRVMATVHPSSILRAPDGESRRAEMELFVADLRTAVSLLKSAMMRNK